MNAIDAGNKKHYFTFKENMTPFYRMPPSVSSSKYGREPMARFFEVPTVTTSKNLNSMYDESVAFKESYSSAIEPMDYDDIMNFVEWGNEREERNSYEMDAMPTLAKSCIQAPRQMQPAKKRMKIPSTMFKIMKKTPSRSNCMEKTLHQSVLSVDDTNGLGFHVDPNQTKAFSPAPMNLDASGKKIFPMWSVQQCNFPRKNKDFSLPRIFTVTVDKLQKWPQVLTGTKVIFELYGILDNVTQGYYSSSKNIILKGEGIKNRLNCTFYEIDRVFPAVEKGHWHRCIVLLKSNGNCQCLSIRSAKPKELKNLDKMIMYSSKEKALLLKGFSP